MKHRKRLLVALALLTMATTMGTAQEWTVIELPAKVADMPQLVQERFGCSYQELPEKYNLSHVRFTGSDFDRSDNDNNGQQAMAALVKKAKVVDLSQVRDNEATVQWYAERPSNSYPGPERAVQFVNSGAKDSLEHFLFPKTLTIIKNFTFGGRKKLKQVTWPDRVEKFSDWMFINCDALEQMTLPTGITEVPRTCFQRCYALKSVTVPAGVKVLREEVFQFCYALETVVLPDGLETIGYDGFCYCHNLKNITLPQSVTTIGATCFQQCYALTTLALPPRLKEVAHLLFESCKGLEYIVLPDSVTAIGNSAFSGCTALKSVVVPAGITTIGNTAFQNTVLEEFDMPDAVTTIGTSVFQGCKQLRRVHLSRWLTVIPQYTFNGCTSLAEVNIPMRVVTIGQSAFNGCTSLPSLVLPEGITQIEGKAFSGTRFDHITLPQSLQTIGSDCFNGSHLRSVDVPANVVQIGGGAFAYCDSLRHATLPDGLLYLHGSAFRGCKLLEDVPLPSSLRYMGDLIFADNKRMTHYVQPPLINVVPSSICNGCDNLESITLHERVTSVGSRAFRVCSKLTHIDLPQSLQVIGEYAFAECPLTEINLPPSLRKIEGNAFDCAWGGLYKHVKVPEGVTSIGSSAFCSRELVSIDFPSSLGVLEGQIIKQQNEPLDSIVVRSLLPPAGSGRVPSYNRGPLYVPPMSIDAYKRDSRFNGSDLRPLTNYTPQTVTVATTVSSDSTWFPVVSGANLHITHNATKAKGQLHVGKSTNWAVSNLLYDYYKPYNNNDAQTPSLIVEGMLTAQSMEMNLNNFYADGWFFFTPPFDMKAADLTCNDPRTPWVLRTFDGAQRAAGNHYQVWQNVEPGATLEAGRAYIMQYGQYRQQQAISEWASVGSNSTTTFHFASSSPLRTLALASADVKIPLMEYKGEFPHNEGWNLVGNPYMAYFDIRYLDYDGPILVPSGNGNRSFTAYSPLDDAYILRPLGGFLLQRSATQASITFQPEGRQGDLAVRQDATNSARSLRRAAQRQQRVVYDAVLQRHTEQGDSLLTTTRIVQTPRATEAYDRGQDAPFITMDDSISALYSRTAGIAYCLNELPPTTPTVQLCMRLQQPGTYTLRLSVRGQAFSTPHLWLKDKETGTETDLLTNGYTFTIAEPCTMNNRFVLQLADGIASVPSVEATPQQTERLYDLQGRRVSTPAKGLYIKNGKKMIHN